MKEVRKVISQVMMFLLISLIVLVFLYSFVLENNSVLSVLIDSNVLILELLLLFYCSRSLKKKKFKQYFAALLLAFFAVLYAVAPYYYDKILKLFGMDVDVYFLFGFMLIALKILGLVLFFGYLTLIPYSILQRAEYIAWLKSNASTKSEVVTKDF